MPENRGALRASEPDCKHERLHNSALLRQFVISLTRNVCPTSVLLTWRANVNMTKLSGGDLNPAVFVLEGNDSLDEWHLRNAYEPEQNKSSPTFEISKRSYHSPLSLQAVSSEDVYLLEENSIGQETKSY